MRGCYFFSSLLICEYACLLWLHKHACKWPIWLLCTIKDLCYLSIIFSSFCCERSIVSFELVVKEGCWRGGCRFTYWLLCRDLLAVWDHPKYAAMLQYPRCSWPPIYQFLRNKTKSVAKNTQTYYKDLKPQRYNFWTYHNFLKCDWCISCCIFQ